MPGNLGNMNIIADLQLHSKYSRAVSKHMVPAVMATWGKKKGIDLLATGDWMHPLWFRELQLGLEEEREGIFRSKEDPDGARYLLSAEISSIYSQGGKGRRVHTLVFAPSFEVAGKINKELTKRGCNLSSDGRPIVGLSCKEIADIVFTVSEKCLVIPAHAWTPWFAMYGSKSGFDSIEECFGQFADKIYAVETGLSSDPAMNWKIGDLDRRAIVSFSDAHSPAKLGREATVFKARNSKFEIRNFTYNDIYWAIAERYLGKNEGGLSVDYTMEFYPEEGKYHWTGHRKCEVRQSPEETRKKGTQCHVCGKGLTVGVEHRVDELTQEDRFEQKPVKKQSKNGVTFNYHPTDETRPGYVMMVPLAEILSEVHEVGVNSKKIAAEYENLVGQFGSEFVVLLEAGEDDLVEVGGEKLAEAIGKVRAQDIAVSPGYDGEFGIVNIWGSDKVQGKKEQQMGLF